MKHTTYIAFLCTVSLCYAFANDVSKLSIMDLCKTPIYVQQVMAFQHCHLDNSGMSYTDFEKHMQKENAKWDQFILDDSQRPEFSFNSYNIHFRRLMYDALQIKYDFYSWIFDVLNMQKVKYIGAYENGMLNDPNLKKLYIANYSVNRPNRNKYFLYYEASCDRLRKTIEKIRPDFIKAYNKIAIKLIVALGVLFDIDVKKAKANFMFEEKGDAFIGFVDDGQPVTTKSI